jgi:hypothetical protein
MATIGELTNTTADDPGEPTPDMPKRSYYCRGCNQHREDYGVPRGWYALTRHPGSDGITRPPNDRPWVERLGVFCSVACIASQVGYLENRERRTGMAPGN